MGTTCGGAGGNSRNHSCRDGCKGSSRIASLLKQTGEGENPIITMDVKVMVRIALEVVFTAIHMLLEIAPVARGAQHTGLSGSRHHTQTQSQLAG